MAHFGDDGGPKNRGRSRADSAYGLLLVFLLSEMVRSAKLGGISHKLMSIRSTVYLLVCF